MSTPVAGSYSALNITSLPSGIAAETEHADAVETYKVAPTSPTYLEEWHQTDH